MQCLSHTPLLTEYFLSGSYVNDVNVENKLGLQVSRSFGQRLRFRVWRRIRCVDVYCSVSLMALFRLVHSRYGILIMPLRSASGIVLVTGMLSTVGKKSRFLWRG